MTHLTQDQVSGWRDQSLDAEELLAISDHIAGCEACRLKLRPAGAASRAVALVANLDSDDERAHLTPEQLLALVDGRLSSDELAHATAHVEACALCRGDLDDLRGFVRTRRRMWVPRVWRVAAALAAVAVLAGIVWQMQPSGQTLRDAHATLRWDSGGEVSGVPKRFAGEVAQALRAQGKLALPALVASLARVDERQRAVDEVKDQVELLAPRSTVEPTDRPTLVWQGPAYWTYQVEVFDADFNLLASSEHLQALSWKPPSSLPRGTELTWEVTALTGDAVLEFPVAPRAPAVFRIATLEEAATVDAARASGSHLVTGLALWNIGAIAAAETEFEALRQLNPESDIAQALVTNSRDARAKLGATLPISK